MNEHAAELVWLLWTILGGLVVLIIGMIKMYLVDLRRWQSMQEQMHKESQEKQDKMHSEIMKLVSSLNTRVAHIEGRLGIVPQGVLSEDE